MHKLEIVLIRIIIFSAMFLVQGVHVWAATFSLPSVVATPKTAATKFSTPAPTVKPPMETKNLPVEVPLQMKDFPPLQSMHFDMAPTFQNTPVSNHVDGSRLYHQNCSECHGLQTTSSKRGMSFSQMSSGFIKKHQAIKLPPLDQTQLRSIVDALGGK